MFDIDVGGVTAPSVVLGEQFAHGVFLKLRQQLTAGVTSVVLEYEVTGWLRLRSGISETRTAAPSLFNRSERGAVKLVFTFRH